MNLPNLPTDNLYKFIALAGLAVIFFSIVLPKIALHNLQLELLKTNGELNVLQAEYDFLQEEIKCAPNCLEDAAKYREKMKELRIRTLQLKSKDEAERFLHRQTKIWNSAAAAGFLVGTIMVTLGFRLWYQRVQKYQDILLKKEAGEVIPVERKGVQSVTSQPETEEMPTESSEVIESSRRA